MGASRTEHHDGIPGLWNASAVEGVGMAWLAQAGFAMRSGTMRWLIDPFLSPHPKRLVPPPIAAERLTKLDWVLCSHGHLDHLDGATLVTLAGVNPRCQFVVPAAEMPSALRAGLAEERLLPVNAGEVVSLREGGEVHILASAHEQLKTNDRGEHFFLGFVFKLPRITFYHAGDCVVYAGLTERLREIAVDVALLPVNGRDAERLKRGVVGNMNSAEARHLCEQAGIGMMMPYHFDMFPGNTVPRQTLEAEARQWTGGTMVVPELGVWWEWSRI